MLLFEESFQRKMEEEDFRRFAFSQIKLAKSCSTRGMHHEI